MKELRIRWLLEEDSPHTEITHTPEAPLIQHYPGFPEDLGHSSNVSARLDVGIYIFRTTFQFKCQKTPSYIGIADVKGELPEPAFMVRSVESGNCIQYERIPEAIVSCKPGVDLFRNAKEFSFHTTASSSSNLDTTSLCIYRSKIEYLLGKDIVAQLLAALGVAFEPSIRSAAIPRHISVPLRQAMLSPYQGQLKLLAAQAKVLEYLSGITSYVLHAHPEVMQSSQKRTLIAELHEYLMALEGKLPPLVELAQRYQVSTRTLNEEFKKKYGMPIVSFVMDHRLRASHEALLHSNIPIKAISSRIGYSHVNHFTSAFSKKFGYPPGYLRKLP